MPPVIKIPRRFWQDCVDCNCDVPRSFGPNRRHCVWIEAEHPHLPELIARAEMYADLRNGYWESSRGLVLSARATLKAIKEAA